MDRELAKQVVTAFGLDERVAALIERCTSVLVSMHDDAGAQRLRQLTTDVQAPGLVMDIGVAYLLNGMSFMHTHPDAWPHMWRRVRSSPIGHSLPDGFLRKKMQAEHKHRLRLLEETFPVVRYNPNFTEISDAVREVVCQYAIRIDEPDVLMRAWKAAIACYLIAVEIADAHQALGGTVLRSGGLVDFLGQQFRVGEHDLVRPARLQDHPGRT